LQVASDRKLLSEGRVVKAQRRTVARLGMVSSLQTVLRDSPEAMRSQIARPISAVKVDGLPGRGGSGAVMLVI
jgi:hypothetical protein